MSAASLRRPSPARQVAVGSHPPQRGAATKPLSSAASLQYQMWNLLGSRRPGHCTHDSNGHLHGNGVPNFSVDGRATVVRALPNIRSMFWTKLFFLSRTWSTFELGDGTTFHQYIYVLTREILFLYIFWFP